VVLVYFQMNANRAAKRAKKVGEKRVKSLHIIGFCPNGDRNAS
jgi:hypothetical protein